MKRRSTPRKFGDRLRRRKLTIWGVPVRFEEFWQRDLISAPPQRTPTIKMVEEMEEALAVDKECFSEEAHLVWKRWRAQKKFDPVARVSSPNLPSKRLRIKVMRLTDGRRLRMNSPARRMWAWKMHQGDLYRGLPIARVEKILSASGLPISISDTNGELTVRRARMSVAADEDEAHHLATLEVDYLYARLCSSGIFPPKSNVPGHVQLVAKRCEEFLELLSGYNTDRMWASIPRSNPPSRLAYLRQEVGDFLLEAQTWLDFNEFSQKWDREQRELEKVGRQPHSRMAAFIAEEVGPAYERIYGLPCGVTRTGSGPPGGSFIAFARAFFDEAGFMRTDSRGKRGQYPSAETIAAAVNNRRLGPA